MEFDAFLTAIRQEGEALLGAAAHGLDVPVPSCPGWVVADVVQHTGVVHRHKEQIVRERWLDEAPAPVAAPEDDLFDWFREGLDRLIHTLAAHDPAEPAWTWHEPDQTVGFWYRRMAHETAVHRVDAELAHHEPRAVTTELAADGLDEILRVMLTGYPDWSEMTPSADTLRLVCTDAHTEFGLRRATFTGTSPHSGREYVDAPTFVFDAVTGPTTDVHGSASDLMLYTWGRVPSDSLRVEGNGELLHILRSVAQDVTQ